MNDSVTAPSSQTLGDRELLAEFVRTHSGEAFGALVSRYSPLVYSVCLRVLGERASAEDAAQAAFLVLFSKARSLAPETVLSNWLYGTANHCAQNIRREAMRRARREREAEGMVDTTSSQAAHTAWEEIRPELDQAIAALPLEQRETLSLRYFEGLSSDETAQRLGCAEKTVRTRLYRALETLRSRLRTREALEISALALLLADNCVHAAPVTLAPSITAACLGHACGSPTALASAAETMRWMGFVKLKALGWTLALLLGIGLPLTCFSLSSTRQPLASASSLRAIRPPFWSLGFCSPEDNGLAAGFDWEAVSHVVHVGVEPQADGTLKYSDANFTANARRLIAGAHANEVKVLLHLWSSQNSNFRDALAEAQPVLVRNLVNLIDTFGYDGVDVVWTHAFDGAAMSGLLKALRAALGTRLLIADARVTDHQYWGTAHALVDRLNVTSYDLAGTWNPYSWFNAPLYGPVDESAWSLDLVRKRMLAAGVPASKLNLGIPFYGWVSTGGGINGPRQPWARLAPRLAQITYSELAGQPDLLNATWDEAARVPYLTRPDGWITFENEKSIAAKVDYVKMHQLGGWLIWTLDNDHLPQATPSRPLLNSVKQAWLAPLSDSPQDF